MVEDTASKFKVVFCDLSLGVVPGKDFSHDILGEVHLQYYRMRSGGLWGSQGRSGLHLQYPWKCSGPRDDKTSTNGAGGVMIANNCGGECNDFKEPRRAGVHV